MHPAHPKDKQPGIKAFCVLHAFLHRQNTSTSSMRHSSTVQFHNAKGTTLSAKCCLDIRHVRNEPPSSREGRRDQRERTTLAINPLGGVSMLSTQPTVHNALPLSPPNNSFDILSGKTCCHTKSNRETLVAYNPPTAKQTSPPSCTPTSPNARPTHFEISKSLLRIADVLQYLCQTARLGLYSSATPFNTDTLATPLPITAKSLPPKTNRDPLAVPNTNAAVVTKNNSTSPV